MRHFRKKALSIMVMATLIVSTLAGCRQKQYASKPSVSGDGKMITVEYKDSDLKSDWSEADAVKVVCNGDSVEITGDGASVEGSIVTITKAGTYLISGTLEDGQIRVDAAKEDKVQLVLNNANITCSNGPAIYGLQSDKTILTLADGSDNHITDGKTYVLENAAEGEPNAAIFSKDDITINGSGTLTVQANYNHGVFSKNDLMVVSGSLNINAVNDGLKGRDFVAVKEASIQISAQGDGIQSNNNVESDKGYVVLEGGQLKIEAGLDGVQAETVLQITGGEYNITTGVDSANASMDATESNSAKALKAGTAILITDGTYQVDSSDDSIHSNGSVLITGGTFHLSSGDDGIHAYSSLTVENGNITVIKSYEGFEGQSITIQDGTIHITASDDGFNTAGGNDASAIEGKMGRDHFATDENAFIRITGGYVCVDAEGDGMDSNGHLYIDGGVTLVNGPTNNGNGAMDHNGDAIITGGILVAAGSSGMVETFSDTSKQNSITVNFTTQQSAGTLVNLLDDTGKSIFGFAPSKVYQSIIISTPKLQSGKTYTLTSGGSESTQGLDGYYEESGNTSGTKQTDITLSSIVTKIMNDGSEYIGGDNGMGGGGKGSRPNRRMPDGQKPF